jgi:hypothetical protein
MYAFDSGAVFLIRDQVVENVDAPNNQHVTFSLNLTGHGRCEMFVTSVNLARLQRTPEGSNQSTTSRRNHVIDGCSVRPINLFDRHSVMLRDRPMHSEVNRFGLSW